MSSSVNLKKSSLAGKLLSQTARYMGMGIGSYFSEALPVTSNIAKDAGGVVKSTASSVISQVKNSMFTARQLKQQVGMKNVISWYLQEENNLSDLDDALDQELDFDTDVDSSTAELVKVEINESAKNAKEISKSVVQSSHKLMEAQLHSTANILTAINTQTHTMSTGFDRINDTLGKILEVVTKNTSTLIETTAMVASNSTSDSDSIINGKFNLKKYKNIVSNNLKNSELGLAGSMLSMFMNPSMRSMITPDFVVGEMMQFLVNKKAPNLKKNLKALDQAVNDVIIDSLLRLGSNNSWSTGGAIARIFGISSERKKTDTSRDSLKLKTVPFDSIAHESITNAIPGYLRKILVQLGGKDEIYDYRSRSFKTGNQIKKEFFKAGSNTQSLYDARKNVRNVMGDDGFANAIYDLMLADIGERGMGEDSRELFTQITRDPKKFKEYVSKNLLKGHKFNMREKVRLNQMGKNFNKAGDSVARDIMLHAARNNVSRNKAMEQYMAEANAFNMDLSFINDSFDEQLKATKARYGLLSDKKSSVRALSGEQLSGTNYSNIALYKIFNRLDRGINVFQVGSKNLKSTPFKSMKRELPVPGFFKKKNDTPEDTLSASTEFRQSRYSDENNLLRNNMDENGNEENLSKYDRFMRWGKDRGGKLTSALFSGNPEQVKDAFGLIVRDVSQVTGDSIKKGISNINAQYGNISGFIKHKLFGQEYSYQDGVDQEGNPIWKKVNKNEKGGIFGFVGDYFKDAFTNTKEKVGKWFSDVGKYFDYGPSNGEEKSVAEKRKKIMMVSAGSLAGMGLLGGPIGLVMGAVAGNALDGLNIGSRLKSLFFGRDEKSGKAKGLFTKLADGIIDPIHYEIGKTINTAGNVLKKRILGPLSDIGLAIKNRIESAAESRFGKVFKTIGGWILAPFKKLGGFLFNALKFPISLMGKYTRGKMNVAGFGAGLALNGIANLIAGNSTQLDENGNEISTKDVLKQRRKERAADVKKNKYAKYSDWKKDKDQSRAERLSKFKDYITEDIHTMTQEEIELMKENNQKQQEIHHDVHTLATLGSEAGSIYTHDVGIHDKLDNIFNLLNDGIFGGVKGTFRKPKLGSGDGVIDSSVISAVTVASGDETITTDEYRLATNIMDEASKDNPNKKSVFSKLKQLMSRNNIKKKDAVEKKESIFDKIKEMLGGMGFPNLPGILGSLAAGLALIAGLTGNLNNVLGNLGNAIHKFFGGDTNKEDAQNQDSVDRGLNSVAAMFGFQVGNKFDFANPLANLFHYNTDGAGGKIVDKDKTKAKSNLQFWTPMKEAISNALKGKSSLHTKPSNVIKNTGKNVARIGVLSGLSNLAGAGAKKVAMMFGADEQQGEAIGGATTTATAAGLAMNQITSKVKGKTSVVDNVVSFLRNAIEKISAKIASHPRFAKYDKDVFRKFDQLFNKSIKKISNSLATTISNAITRVTGKEFTKEAATGVLAGIPIVAGGVYGLISGLLTSEHLFGVGPDQADGLMATVAGAMQATFGALEWVPVVGMFVTVLDIFDKFVFASIFGKSFEQMVAEFLYNILQGDSGAELSRKQKHMETLRDDYNKRTGKKLTSAEFNDLVNRKDAVDNFLWGKASYNAAGGIYMDEGGRVPYSGLAGKISSNEGDYAKDEKGNVLKDRFGNSIINVDASGNEKVKGAKFGNKIAETFNGFNRALFGGVKYKTDEKGNAKILDAKNGLYEVEGYDEGFFAKLFKSRNEVSTDLKTSIMDDVATDMAILEKKSKEDKKQNPFDYSKKYDWGNDGRKMTLKEWFEENSISVQKALMFKSFNGLNDTINSTSFNTNNNFMLAGAGGSNSFNPSANYLLNKTPSTHSTPKTPTVANNTNKKPGGFNFFGFRFGGPLDILGGNPLSKDYDITSTFGLRGNENHRGIDIIPRDGSESADILSTSGGRILSVKNNIPSSVTGLNYAGNNSGGNEVIIKGDDGLIYKNYHLKPGSIPGNLRPGSRVERGQNIGKMGSTGRSGGSHLHYQIEAPTGDGRYIPINPLTRIGGKIKNFSKRIGDGVSKEFETWIRIIKELKLQLASSKIGYNQGAQFKYSSNGFSIVTRPDCSGFVSACVSCLYHKPIYFSTHYQSEEMKKAEGFIEAPFPGWDKLYQGDILLNKQTHTEIFSHTENGKHYVWNVGSNTSANNPNPTPSAKSSYETIFRLKSSNGQIVSPVVGGLSTLGGSFMSGANASGSSNPVGIIGALNDLGNGLLYAISGGLIGSNPNQQSSIAGTSSGTFSEAGVNGFESVKNTDISSDSAGLWQYFKGLGYSDIEAAAILGAWKPESGHNSKKVEWDESNAFKSRITHDSMVDDRKGLNDFTEALFAQYAKQGLKINREAYKGSDGNYYPGIGFSQWTGGRAKELLDYAKQNNMKWYDPRVQLSFMDNEFKHKKYYSTVRQKMQAAKDLDSATSEFVKWYVGYTGPQQEARKQAAREFYKQFTNSSPKPNTSFRTGGPIEDDTFLSSFNNNFKTTTSSIGNRINNIFSSPTTPTRSLLKFGKNNLQVNNITPPNLGTDISPIVEALKTIIIHLSSINNNTGSSNVLLTNLNEKDFVDKGLRDTINAFKSNKPQPKQSSYSTARSVAALVRP